MQHERRCSCVHGEDVSIRDVKIKIPDSKYDQGMWMTSCTGSVLGGFGGFEKSHRVVFKRPKKTVDFRGSPRPCGGCRTWFGADGKVIIERLCLSLHHVEKPFNSKVIKSFVTELRSRKCFLCFGIPMLSIYELWTFYVHFKYSCRALLLNDYRVQQKCLPSFELSPVWYKWI